MVPKYSAEGLSSVPKHKNADLSYTENKYVNVSLIQTL